MARLQPKDRRAMILSTAIELGNLLGMSAINFQAVASRCTIKTTGRTVRHYFPKVRDLWTEAANDKRAGKMLKDEAVAMGLVK